MDIHPGGFVIELSETHSKEEPDAIQSGYISDAVGNVRSLIICQPLLSLFRSKRPVYVQSCTSQNRRLGQLSSIYCSHIIEVLPVLVWNIERVCLVMRVLACSRMHIIVSNDAHPHRRLLDWPFCKHIPKKSRMQSVTIFSQSGMASHVQSKLSVPGAILLSVGLITANHFFHWTNPSTHLEANHASTTRFKP